MSVGVTAELDDVWRARVRHWDVVLAWLGDSGWGVLIDVLSARVSEALALLGGVRSRLGAEEGALVDRGNQV